MKILAAVWPGLLMPGRLPRAAIVPDFPVQLFSAVIDTFVPADDWPGALALGIDTALLETVQENPAYRERLGDALFLLDHLSRAEHGLDFEALAPAGRSRVLEGVLSDRSKGELRAQLAGLRLKTLTRFYTSAESFAMLEYHPPSQGGYPDYAKPPV